MKRELALEYLSFATYGPRSDALAPALFDGVTDRLAPLVRGHQAHGWDGGAVKCEATDDKGESIVHDFSARVTDVIMTLPREQQSPLRYILGERKNPDRKFDAHLDYWMSGWWRPSDSGRVAGLCFGIRTSLLAHHVLPANNSEPAITSALHQILDYLIDVWEPHYGLVDVSDWQHAGAGVAYEVNPVQVPWSHPQQQAETAVWNADEERQRDHVRGLYWGQLLNARHLAKLGGIDAVRRDLEKMGRGYYLTPKAKGYAFLQLGPGPMNSSTFGIRIPYVDAAVWYRRKIVECGLLI